MRVAYLLVLSALIAGSTAARQPEAGSRLPSVELPAELDRVLRDYEKAWQARDAAALSELFAGDGFVLANGGPPVRGRAAIRAAYSGAGGPLALRALAFSTSGDVGYIIGGFGREPAGADTGKFVLALKRGAGGGWLIMADMDPTAAGSRGRLRRHPRRHRLRRNGQVDELGAGDRALESPLRRRRRMSKRADASHSIQEHFRDREPVVQAIYDRILDSARRFGPVGEEAKKTSVHLTNRTAFAGVATRRAGLVLTLKLARDVKSPRVSKLERVSANRWHLEIKLSKPGDVDADLRGWLREAYTLAA